jgi:hypothetical protein
VKRNRLSANRPAPVKGAALIIYPDPKTTDGKK